LKVQREAYQIGVKFESDMALGPNLSLTPAVAVFGGQTYDHYSVASAINPGTGPFAPFGVTERLRTTEIGGYFGARLTWQFMPGFAAHFGGTAGPVWMRTRFAGENCFNTGGVTLTVPCGPSNPSFLTSSASDSDSAVGFRGTASLGIVGDLRIVVVSVGGFVRYDTHIPGVTNPQQTGGTVAAPASVRFDDGFAYGGFLTLRLPLPY
jgi:hypothetical protein